jgi:hypothetical protein
LADLFYLEGCLKLELSCIWINAVVWNGKGRQNTVWQTQTTEIQVIKNSMQWYRQVLTMNTDNHVNVLNIKVKIKHKRGQPRLMATTDQERCHREEGR